MFQVIVRKRIAFSALGRQRHATNCRIRGLVRKAFAWPGCDKAFRAAGREGFVIKLFDKAL
jgi:hypothetical protein